MAAEKKSIWKIIGNYSARVRTTTLDSNGPSKNELFCTFFFKNPANFQELYYNTRGLRLNCFYNDSNLIEKVYLEHDDGII